MKRTREKLEDADLILLVIDGSRKLDEDDREIIRLVEERKRLVVLNKRDLPSEVSVEDLKNLIGSVPVVSISALRNEGIEDLRGAIRSTLIEKKIGASPEQLIVANVRHKAAISRSRENLSNAIRGLEEGVSLEFTAFEIRSALEALGELVGETANEDVLNRIFEQFCIGK